MLPCPPERPALARASAQHDSAACPGVIGGIVSFCLLHAFEWGLDWLSSRTNGAFGSTTPAIAANGHHGINPKDSAHDATNPNGKTAVDEEVSPFAGQSQACSPQHRHAHDLVKKLHPL